MGSHRRNRFRLNKADGKVMGVCAGLADHFEVDVTLVRVGAALAILTSFPFGLFAYFILAMVAGSDRGLRRRHRHEAAPLGEASGEAARERVRDLDAHMQAVETYVTSSNTALANEIDALR